MSCPCPFPRALPLHPFVGIRFVAPASTGPFSPATAGRPAAAAAAPTSALALAGDVHLQVAAFEGVAIERLDRLLGPLHLHEGEAAGPTGVAVGDHLDRGDFAVLREQAAEVILGGAE